MNDEMTKRDLEECVMIHEAVMEKAIDENINPANVIKSCMAIFVKLFTEVYKSEADSIILKNIQHGIKEARKFSEEKEKKEIH